MALEGLKSCTALKEVELPVYEGDIPEGEYQGKWSGHQVRFFAHCLPYLLRTDMGVRGQNIPCTIYATRKDGKTQFEVKVKAND